MLINVWIGLLIYQTGLGYLFRMLIDWSNNPINTLSMEKSWFIFSVLSKIINREAWLKPTTHLKKPPSIWPSHPFVYLFIFPSYKCFFLFFFDCLVKHWFFNFALHVVTLRFSAFIQEFRNWESAWALEALYAIVYEIRVLAERVRCRMDFSSWKIFLCSLI